MVLMKIPINNLKHVYIVKKKTSNRIELISNNQERVRLQIQRSHLNHMWKFRSKYCKTL